MDVWQLLPVVICNRHELQGFSGVLGSIIQKKYILEYGMWVTVDGDDVNKTGRVVLWTK